MNSKQQEISDELVKIQAAMVKLQGRIKKLKPLLREFKPKNSRQEGAKWALENRDVVSTSGYMEINEVIDYINDNRQDDEIRRADREADNAAYPR